MPGAGLALRVREGGVGAAGRGRVPRAGTSPPRTELSVSGLYRSYIDILKFEFSCIAL